MWTKSSTRFNRDGCIGINRGIDAKLLELDGTKTKIQSLVQMRCWVFLWRLPKLLPIIWDYPCTAISGGVNAYVLPIPMMNIINGGSHSDAPIAFQEFMIRPVGAPCFREGLRMGCRNFPCFEKSSSRQRAEHGCRRWRGVCSQSRRSTEEAIDSILTAIRNAGYEPGKDVMIGLDCAHQSEFYTRRHLRLYTVWRRQRKKETSAEQVEYLRAADCEISYRLHWRRHERKRLGRMEIAYRKNRQQMSAGWRRLVVTNVEFLEKGIKMGCGTPSSSR